MIFPDMELYKEVLYSRKLEKVCYEKVQKVCKPLFLWPEWRHEVTLDPDSMTREMT